MPQDRESLLEEGRTLVEMKVAGKGAKGDYFVKFKGIVIFIKDAEVNIGDMIDIEITNVQSNCAFAKLLKISR